MSLGSIDFCGRDANGPRILSAVSNSSEVRDFPHLAAEFCRQFGVEVAHRVNSSVIFGNQVGMGNALSPNAVTHVRSRFSAFMLAVIIAATTSGTAFAQTLHPLCAAKQHDCGSTTTIAKCCCGAQDSSGPSSTTGQSRVELRANTALPVLPNVISVVRTGRSLVAVQTSPPLNGVLDLPTLYVSFLI